MSHDEFKIEQRESVAIFRICRPNQANALTRNILLGLGEFARHYGRGSDARALIITAEGSRHFCAGADLKERAGWTEDDVRTQLDLYRSELGALDSCTKPVIAAVNGLAFGGGLEIALACDLRVAVESATFACPEVSLAIIPGAGGTQRLTRLIGPGRAKEMILLAKRIEAREAMQWGLVNRICSPSTNVLDDAIGWIEPVLSGAPLAQAAALEAIDAAGPDLDAGLQHERSCYERLLPTRDRLEAIAAFSEKRKPKFQGS